MGNHLGVAYNLRLSQELKDKIMESAQTLNRSMNADIVARLEKSFGVGQTERMIVSTEYHQLETYNFIEKAEDASSYLSNFFRLHPEHQLINIETTAHGIKFWHSYPVKPQKQ